MKKIGFIGLGNMGKPMALNLVKKGYSLKVFDLQPAPTEELKAAGAEVMASAIDAGNDVDVLITMLPSSPHVEALYLSDTGLLAHTAGKPIVIDCSTIAPESARKVAKAAQQFGIPMLDAPVSGGTAGAEAGTLTFIIGGDATILERTRPIFEAMGKNIFHAGNNGAGQVAKICNNMLLAIHMAGTAEALQLGVNNGLDASVLSEIMSKSSGRNWSLELYNPYPGVMENVPASRGYQGGFMCELMNKDLGLAMEAMMHSKSTSPMGALAKSLYAMHCNNGHSKEDFSSIQKLYSGKS
ncbi:MAG: 3-hydroxyisobutyrate dehydrogenase [Hahellaceae bacterium]|nr:3-hydroxyisobutyrate dehydrogenase [Hahellaceae bacterium]MCP5210663.1 3-hydroxyisobutyrate dehydrogenase [Hahellaceae bacterium]